MGGHLSRCALGDVVVLGSRSCMELSFRDVSLRFLRRMVRYQKLEGLTRDPGSVHGCGDIVKEDLLDLMR